MTVTGRQGSRKLSTPKKGAGLSARSGEEIARASRVEELRRLVASGRYKVEPHKLALKILVRALKQGE